MTKNPVSVEANASIERVEGLLLEMDVRHLPVVDDDSLVGIISDRDLAPYRQDDEDDAARTRTATASQIMSSDLLTVSAEAELSEAVDTMLDHRVGALPVTNEETRELVGIISYVDVLRAVRSAL